MKKRSRILSAILAIALLASSVLVLSVSAVETATEQTAARGQLAITEINGADINNTAYQYIEILNVSDTTVNLAEYYLYRYGGSNSSDNWDQLLLQYMLGDVAGASHNLTRVNLADYTSATLAPGEVAILWLDNANATCGKGSATATDMNQDGVIDEKDFRLKWSIADGIKVIDVAFSHNAKFFWYTTDHTANSGFLPLRAGDCILQLTHKNAVFEGVKNENGLDATPATDSYDFQYAWWNTTAKVCGSEGDSTKPVDFYGAEAYARHKAADCSAIWYTEINSPDVVPTENVQHYYDYLDVSDYRAEVASLGTSVAEPAACASFVSGKLNENGRYAVGNGLTAYVNKGDSAAPLYFVNDGTSASASAGKLEVGQFGYKSAQMMGTQSRVENDGTYSVRFVASIDEADLEKAQRAGFDIVANYTDKNGKTGVKVIPASCTAVYASVYGKGENGTEKYTKADLTNGHTYFLTVTVENISVDTYGKIVFTITPYIVHENGVKNTFYTAYATFEDGVRDTSADGTEPLSKEEQILNGFTVATQTTPTLHEIDGLQPTGEYEGIQAVWFDGMDQNGSKTKVFAYVGFPEGASESARVPAVVLLHGGGGHAFLCWVKMWNDRGYAAIAVDTTGYFPTAVNAGATEACTNWSYGIPASLAETGYISAPDKDNMGNSTGLVDNMWMYHAVGQSILAGNILRADARVDSEKVGITGVSWGGVITSVTIGYDTRFAFAVPVYGSGYLDEAKSWMKDNFSSTATKELWLAQDRFENVDMPVLWLCWNDDNCFSINSNSKSYLDTVQNNAETRLSMVPLMYHSHTHAWARPESMAFADSIVGNGAKLTGFAAQPTGREINVALTVDPSATVASATLYYITEAMTYSNYNKFGTGSSTYMDQTWQTAELSVNGGNVTGSVPESAKGYYIEIRTTVGGVEYVTCSSYAELT